MTPTWLNALVNASRTNQSPPLVRVRRIEQDFGPATKLIPSVMEAHSLLGGENVLLLVCDDDTLYPPRLLETLLEWHRRLPTAALALSGWPVVAKTFRYPHWSENYLVYGNECFAPHPVSVIRGNTGYAQKRGKQTRDPSFSLPRAGAALFGAFRIFSSQSSP